MTDDNFDNAGGKLSKYISIKKNLPTRSRKVFSSFLRATVTHSQHAELARKTMEPFIKHFFSLYPSVPFANAVCPPCDKRPLHKRASPLGE